MTPKISIKNSQQTNPNNPSDPLCLSYINSFKIDCFRRDPALGAKLVSKFKIR